MHTARPNRAFTLIELLIVVAIIAILAAIAVPNFLEAQVRAKVSRVRADMRTVVTAVETYRVDHNAYPEGTDNPNNMDPRIVAFFTPLGLGNSFYAFRTRGAGGLQVGRDFAGVTTPIAYITTIPLDPFAGQAAGFLPYAYRNAKVGKNGFVVTSAGPDADIAIGRGNTNPTNVLSTSLDPGTTPRLGDINEAMVCFFIESAPVAPATAYDLPNFKPLLEGLLYDPTNGTVSDGDLARVSPQL